MRTRLQKRKIGDYQNFQIFCQRQTLFFVVVRTGSQTDTFGKSTIFSSFAAVQVLVKRGLTVYRLLITMIRIGNYFLTLFHGRGGGGGKGTPYNGLYGEAPPERGRDFTRWSIWKGREICHLGLWKGPKGLTDECYGFIKSGKRSIFVINSYLNDNAFTAVKEVYERGTICQ